MIQVLGGLTIASGIAFSAGDKFCAKAYDVGDLGPLDSKCASEHNLCCLSAGLVIYSLLFRNDVSFNLAMAIGNLPWAFFTLGDLLNESYKTTGPSAVGTFMTFAFTSAAAYAGLTDAKWAGNAFKASAVYGIACGIPCLLAPAKAYELWECKGKTELTEGMIVGVGMSLIAMGTFMASLAWGDSIVTAIGKYALAFVIGMIKAMFFSPEFTAAGIKKEAMYFWLILDSIGAFSIVS
jgi:hypothetical protein